VDLVGSTTSIKSLRCPKRRQLPSVPLNVFKCISPTQPGCCCCTTTKKEAEINLHKYFTCQFLLPTTSAFYRLSLAKISECVSVVSRVFLWPYYCEPRSQGDSGGDSDSNSEQRAVKIVFALPQVSCVEPELKSNRLLRFYAFVIAFYVQLPPIECWAFAFWPMEIYQLAETAISNTINWQVNCRFCCLTIKPLVKAFLTTINCYVFRAVRNCASENSSMALKIIYIQSGLC